MERHTFKDIARAHQVNYFKSNYGIEEFATIIRKPNGCEEAKVFKIEGLLKKEDADKGIIFYENYRKQILDEICRLKKDHSYSPSGMMISHTLRSEHIPWNLFFPMSLSNYAKDCAKCLFNDIIKKTSLELPMIKEITDIFIEHSPEHPSTHSTKPKKIYLNDNTSFDTYISYISEDGKNGGIGIEVKYTEEGYRPGVKEKRETIDDHKNASYRYWSVMKKSHYYIPDADNGSDGSDWSPLVKDDLRQIWRNHLLGASMVQNDDIQHFLSIHLYPSGNTHFHGKEGAVEKYRSYLSNEGLKTWTAVTFEELFQLIRKHFTDDISISWAEYLEERYLFNP